jgi:glucosamine--fructose-6-phosphate aminotransferase (isomerizing)
MLSRSGITEGITVPGGMAGELMRAEMAEQPQVLRALIARGGPHLGPYAGVVIVARGSSDHAAIYGRYLLELATGRPVALAAPSLFTRYGARTDVSGWLVVGVSQSGATPEIVEVVGRLRATGGQAVAITNDPASPLARASEVVIGLGAGAERAVPATKTLTAQFAAFAVLAAGLGPVPFAAEDLAQVPEAVEAALAAPLDAWPAGEELVVAARGFLFAAALETALKVREAALVNAAGYSVADLLHGPIAAIDAGTPALLLDHPGPASADVARAAQALRDRGADVRVHEGDGLPEALAPIPAAVHGQRVALELSLRRGLDPDAPRGLSKVTRT